MHFNFLMLGPLLWHWENNTTNDPSVELDLEEVKELCKKLGFKLEVSFSLSLLYSSLNKYQNERMIDTTYTNNSQSMLGYVYNTAFWTATKVEESK